MSNSAMRAPPTFRLAHTNIPMPMRNRPIACAARPAHPAALPPVADGSVRSTDPA
jgi:hypothetical protein